MEIEKKIEGEKATISLKGRLDTVTAPSLEPELVETMKTCNELVLDFQELVYVSSAGLRLVLMGYKTMSAKNGKFSLVHVSDDIKEILSMTGFDSFLTIE